MRRELRSKGRPVAAPPANDNDPHEGGRGGRAPILREYLMLLVVLLGVALFYWLSVTFSEWDRVQTCVTMGKRNCNPSIELNRLDRQRAAPPAAAAASRSE